MKGSFFRVSPRLLVLGILLMSFSSCRRAASTGQSQMGANPDVLRKAERQVRDPLARLADAVGKSDEISRKAAASIAADSLVKIYKSRDPEDGREFQALLEKKRGISCEDAGAEAIAAIRPDEWSEFLEFIKGLDSRQGYDLASGALSQAMILDPEKGPDLWKDLCPDFKRDGALLGAGSFTSRVWSRTGEVLVGEMERGGIASLIGKADEDERRNFITGIARGVAGAVEKGDSESFKLAIHELPDARRRELLYDLSATPLAVTKDNVGSFTDLLGVFASEENVDKSVYSSLGEKIGDDAAVDLFCGDNPLPPTEETEALVSGWVLKRPKAAVTLLCSADSGDLVRPAFYAWAEADSMEASEWLLAQESGPARELCSEALCDYLLSKKASTEVDRWLETLESDARIRLLTKHNLHE